ncbi:MAG: hypothetical protein WCL30_00675 [Pseudomonadota bacterium]
MNIEDILLESVELFYSEIKKAAKGKTKSDIEYALAISLSLNELLKKQLPKIKDEALYRGRLVEGLFQYHIIRRDEKRQAGTKKGRLPFINEWIKKEYEKKPFITVTELWRIAPEEITDCIGIGAFKKRVTVVRKEIKNATIN